MKSQANMPTNIVSK